MSFLINKSGRHTFNKWIQIFLIYLQLIATLALPMSPASGDWMCNAGNVLQNQTLNAGIDAGQFKKVGPVENIKNCIQYCCNDERCNVAFMARETCYLVSCNNDFLCRPVSAKSVEFHPQIAYVTHQKLRSANSRIQTLKAFLRSPEITDHLPIVHAPFFSHKQTLEEQGQKRVFIQKESPITESSNGENKLLLRSPDIVKTDRCYPAHVYKSVSLKYGPDSGDFYDYGKIGDMRQCVDLCCKDKQCDVSFMVAKTCYTISCYSLEKCQMIPSSADVMLTSQLAYVIKKKDLESQEKLRISRKHENLLLMQKDQENYLNWKFHHMDKKNEAKKLEVHELNQKKKPIYTSNRFNKQMFDPNNQETFQEIPNTEQKVKKIQSKSITKKIDKEVSETNVPNILTKDCQHNKIMKNHALVGGQKAGIYTFRGFTPGFHSCLNLCCADLFCDAAFMLGKRCYSVQCYKNGQCTSRPAKTEKLKSMLAFIERPNTLDISEKRTSIPGRSPSDRQYTVSLNITNEDYKEEMIDSESLEFLNFAEKLRGMISGLYGNVGGFKFVEITKFKPKLLVATFNITTDKSTNPKVLLQKMVDVLRKGELLSHEDPLSGKLTVDVRGFEFLNDKGYNLICAPEFNYNVHWPLGIYGTFVSVPCPRMASGLTTRQCSGTESRKAKWLVPDFSDCVTYKYEALLREVKLLATSKVSPQDLTSASIIDRLLQYTTTDTYGSKQPKEFQSINQIKDAKPTKKVTQKPSEVEQIRFAKPENLKESLTTEQLKAYLHKVGLSALLGKTNHPDLMSLYKSLAAKTGRIEKTGAEIIKGSSSIKYPTQNIHDSFVEVMSPNQNTLSKVRLTSKQLPRPITMEYDKVSSPGFEGVSLTNNDPKKLIKGQSQVFWSDPKPIGELGAQSPISKLGQHIHPAMISNVVYEHEKSNNHAIDSFKKVPVQNVTTMPINDQQQRRKSQSHVLMEKQDIQPDLKTSLYPQDPNPNPQDRLEPHGLPVFESRRDWMIKPSKDQVTNAKQQLKSIRRKRGDEDAFNDISYNNKNEDIISDEDENYSSLFERESNENRKKRFLDSWNETEESQKVKKQRSFDDVDDFDVLFKEKIIQRRHRREVAVESPVEALLNLEEDTEFKNNLPELISSPRNIRSVIDPSIIEAFFATGKSLPHVARAHHVHSTLTEIKNLKNNQNIASKGINKNMTPTATGFLKINSIKQEEGITKTAIKKHQGLLKHTPSAALHFYHPDSYKKKVEKPTIVDIPTGRIITPGGLKISDVTIEDMPAESKETNFESNTEQRSSLNQQKTSVKVNSEVLVCRGEKNCNTNQKNEVTNTNSDTLHSRPSSSVIGETQVPEAPSQDDDSVTPSFTTPAPTRTTQKASTTTIKPPTKPIPVDELPTVDQEDETEPEQEEKPRKPVISITVVNKTEATPKPTPAIEKNPPIPTLEEEATKPKPKPKPNANELIFTYEGEEEGGKQHAPMFGGDIMVTIDITDELIKLVESNNATGITLQEIEEFIQASSAVLDEGNEMEWKHTVRHLDQLRNENDQPSEMQQSDPNDWRIIHKQKFLEKSDLLMGYISTIELYAKTVATSFSRYNTKYQQPIITKNIVMQVRTIVVEKLIEETNGKLEFPEYSKDERLSTWKCGIESISLPVSVISKKLESTKTIHVTFLRFRTIALIQRQHKDEDENNSSDAVDGSPMIVGSQILTMHIEPSLGEDLKKPVSMTFANDDISQEKLPHDCSSWNNTKNLWDGSRCKKTFFNESITTCECNHLTIFGVLVDTSSKPLPESEKPTEKIKEEPPSKPDNEKIEQDNVKGDGELIKEEPVETTKAPIEEQTKPDTTPKPTETTTTTTTTSTATTTQTTTTVATIAPDKGKQGNKKKSKWKWWWWLLLLLLLLLLILLLICCCCCCGWCPCWKKKKKEEAVEAEEADTEHSIHDSSHGSLIDKSKNNQDPRKGVVTPGSSTSSRTNSPTPRDSPGWRKLMSNAHHPRQMLLKEKALLFKDYVQPYHFLHNENEKPETSSESVYGSSITSYPETSEPSRMTTPKKKRSYQPKPRRERSPPNTDSSHLPSNVEKIKTDSSESEPEVKRKTRRPSLTREISFNSDEDSPISERRHDVMPSNLHEAGSMEWDPYLENKQKGKNKRGKPTPRRKNISPISEEDEESSETIKPTASLEAQNGSDLIDTASSEASFNSESDPGTSRLDTDDRTNSPTRESFTIYDTTRATAYNGLSSQNKEGESPSSCESFSDPRYSNNR